MCPNNKGMERYADPDTATGVWKTPMFPLHQQRRLCLRLSIEFSRGVVNCIHAFPNPTEYYLLQDRAKRILLTERCVWGRGSLKRCYKLLDICAVTTCLRPIGHS